MPCLLGVSCHIYLEYQALYTWRNIPDLHAVLCPTYLEYYTIIDIDYTGIGYDVISTRE